MKHIIKRSLASAALCLVAAGAAHAADRPSEMPKQFAAVRSGADLRSSRTVSVIVSPRRTDDAPLPVRAEKLRSQLVKGIRKMPFTVVSDSSAAQLNVELVIEPHQPLGTTPRPAAPYLFLLVRDHANANVLYCGYQRVSPIFYERALDRLAKDLLRNTAAGPAATGDLNACAAAAMRLPDVGL